jgi:uncharacterized protein
LDAELTAVVESCVNEVGVDLNTASGRLLSFVSGLNERLSNEIVAYRNRVKRFDNRRELLEVKGIGEKAFEQCAGFLRIRNGSEPLDNTGVHPESYDKVRALAEHFKTPLTDLSKLGLTLVKLDSKKADEVSAKIGVDRPTFELIAKNLAKPGRDPREEAPAPLLRSDILKLEDLHEGLILEGTVRNVVDFGAFVDIGLKNDALLHISKMSATGRRITNPLDVLQVGDIVHVKIDKIELDKERVGLAMVMEG